MLALVNISIPSIVISQSAYNQFAAYGYEIKGYVKGLNEGEKVIMSILSGVNDLNPIDSGYVKNGEFIIKGKVPNGPRMYFIDFSKHRNATCRVFIDNGDNIIIKCDSNIEKIKHGYLDYFFAISGSPSNYTWHMLTSGVIVYCASMGLLNNTLRKIQDSIGFDGSLLGPIIEAKKVLSKSFYRLNFNPFDDAFSKPAIPFNILGSNVQGSSEHAPFLMELYMRLPSYVKDNYYGQILKGYADLSVGQKMPEFSFPAPDGKALALKDIVTKSKLTIVNFWGTNSPLTKECHDGLRSMYKKYHTKGLNIIAVSSDDYEEAWKESLQTENYPWYNVLDKKGRVVDTVYHEFTANRDKLRNVTNVLLDNEGKIVLWDPISVELEWYLWKYLDK